MKVSSSKFTFTLLAVAAMMVFGSGTLIQDSFAADPEFTAYHFNSTTTVVEFSEAVNGTMAIADWTIKYTSTGTAGDVSSDVAISDVNNGTKPSAGDITASTSGSNIVGLGYMNDSTTMYLRHASIPTDATYYVNFTGNPLKIDVNGYMLREARVGSIEYTEASREHVEIGSNATAKDWAPPTPVSAKKTGQKTIEVTMSEPSLMYNATGPSFSLSGTTDSVVGSIIGPNATNILYLTTRNIIDPYVGQQIKLSYNTAGGGATGTIHWITDAVNSAQYGSNQQSEIGHGNQMINFTELVVATTAESVTDTVHYIPHIHDEIMISVNSGPPINLNIHDGIISNILLNVGDTVDITVSVGDDDVVENISQVGLITNYDKRPSSMNEYYSTNFDDYNQVGLSVYEWYPRQLDLTI